MLGLSGIKQCPKSDDQQWLEVGPGLYATRQNPSRSHQTEASWQTTISAPHGQG